MDLENLVKQFDHRKQLEITIPTKAVLEIEGLASAIKGELVGMDPGKYFIAKLPRIDMNIRGKLQNGSPLIVKYLHKGSIFAFQAHILASTSKPSELCFITFPQIVSRHELRRHPRVECNLTGMLHLETGNLNGIVADISLGGCCFAYQNQQGNHAALKEGDQVSLTVCLTCIEELTRVPGVVKRVTRKERTHFLGIEFQRLDQEQQFQIGQYIQTVLDVTSLKEDL